MDGPTHHAPRTTHPLRPDLGELSNFPPNSTGTFNPPFVSKYAALHIFVVIAIARGNTSSRWTGGGAWPPCADDPALLAMDLVNKLVEIGKPNLVFIGDSVAWNMFYGGLVGEPMNLPD